MRISIPEDPIERGEMPLVEPAAIDKRRRGLGHGALDAPRARTTICNFQAETTQFISDRRLVVLPALLEPSIRPLSHVVVQRLGLHSCPFCDEIEFRADRRHEICCILSRGEHLPASWQRTLSCRQRRRVHEAEDYW
jgi:hypothetical protein